MSKDISWQPEPATTLSSCRQEQGKLVGGASLWGCSFLTIALLRETGNVRKKGMLACWYGMFSLIILNLLPVFFQDTLEAAMGGGGKIEVEYQSREPIGHPANTT